jgi:hypothetical protein
MKMRLLTVSALLFVATLGLAAAPTGHFEFYFTTNSAPIWDLSGTYQLQQIINGTAGQQIPVQFGVLLEQDDNGQLVGAGASTGMIGTNAVAGKFRVYGRVFTSNGQTRARFTAVFVGRGTIAGTLTRFTVSVQHDAILDPAQLRLTGNARGSAGFSKLTGGPIRSSSLIALPNGNDGSWTLSMDLIPLDSPAGNAAIRLVTGRQLLFDISGSQNVNAATARLLLRGFGTAAGSNFELRTSGATNRLDSIKGRTFGQSINYSN